MLFENKEIDIIFFNLVFGIQFVFDDHTFKFAIMTNGTVEM